MKSCPMWGNEKILEVGGKEFGYVRSVSTGKFLKIEKTGSTVWWKFTCRCGWKSEILTE